MRYTVYRIIVCSRTKIRMISSLRNLCVRILDADRLTIVVFQILDIKSNNLPGIVHEMPRLRLMLILMLILMLRPSFIVILMIMLPMQRIGKRREGDV
jgi:hypothetical protein